LRGQEEARAVLSIVGGEESSLARVKMALAALV
jgi:hypothetical protein